uniref:Izumo sperm-egg fusion protein 4 isoform X3 n=1 Tax=Geotrypetes seraphini TaxID=260995 RepID=A0A6P8S2Y5_GEOSA|nr:izumo sperm-egg fusion protein 4 isoform X3 [Geotrypetes seraphini]
MGAMQLRLPLLLLLLLAVLLTHGCLHCDSAFQQKFTFYRRNMGWKSWWVTDRTAALFILEKWQPRTLEGLQLNVEPEIRVFPQILSSVLKAQTLMLRDEIIERIYKYDTISCITCNASVTICFGYNCGTSEEWELALDSLPKYIKLMSLGFKTPLIPSSQNTTRLTSFSGKFEKDRIFWDKEKVPFKVTYMTCTVA